MPGNPPKSYSIDACRHDVDLGAYGYSQFLHFQLKVQAGLFQAANVVEVPMLEDVAVYTNENHKDGLAIKWENGLYTPALWSSPGCYRRWNINGAQSGDAIIAFSNMIFGGATITGVRDGISKSFGSNLNVVGWENIYSEAGEESPSPENASSGQDNNNTIEVLQHEYAFATSGKLETRAIANCVAFTLYDAEAMVAVMAHVDKIADVALSLDIIFTAFRNMGIDPSRLEARIIGGFTNSSETALGIIRDRFIFEGCQIVQEDTLGSVIRSFGLDVESGQFYIPEDDDSNIPEEEYLSRVHRIHAGTPLNQLCTSSPCFY